jgi:high-affinity nickel permease
VSVSDTAAVSAGALPLLGVLSLPLLSAGMVLLETADGVLTAAASGRASAAVVAARATSGRRG